MGPLGTRGSRIAIPVFDMRAILRDCAPLDNGFNPRHHGVHYHVETKPDDMTWGQASRRGQITKSKPDGYTPGSGTDFNPGESFPGG